MSLAPSVGCTKAPEASTTQKVTLNIGVALPKTPEASAGFRAFVNTQLVESLVGVDWNGRPFGRLISDDWKWSDDGLSLDFHLLKGLQFHDGTPADNEFVKERLKSIFAANKNGRTNVSYESVTDVETGPDGLVKVKLSRREALLIAELSNSTISNPKNDDVGLGPFRLVSRTPKVKLAAFDHYYRGRPSIDFINIEEYAEQRSSWTALLRGEIDAVHEITPAAIDFVKAERQTNVHTFSITRPYFIYLLFNVKHPILKNASVRQALNYAVDRPAIIEKGLNKQGTVADGPIWPFHWAYSAAQKSYTHNIEAATLRLDSAGLKVKPSDTPGGMPRRFKFKCLTIENHATFERVAILLQKQLSEIGVDMEIESVSLQELSTRQAKGDFDAILAERTSGRSLVWTYIMFHSSKYGAPYTAADNLLYGLRSAKTESDMRATVSDLQQVFHDDPPAIFISWPTVSRVVSSKFTVPDEPGRDVISNMWQWRETSAPK